MHSVTLFRVYYMALIKSPYFLLVLGPEPSELIEVHDFIEIHFVKIFVEMQS